MFFFFLVLAVCCGLVLTLWGAESGRKGCEGFGSHQHERCEMHTYVWTAARGSVT